MASAFGTTFRPTTAKSKKASIRQLTENDTKILGPNIQKKLEKTVPPKKFQTRNFKTLNSAYTPILHKPSNQQIFNERKELICNWYDLWTDSQRKKFLAAIFNNSSRSQLIFTQKWFNEHIPLKHLDFTKVLPRCLSLHIMSYLDPRSLSRASMVSWHWKFIAEQDILWMPKCTKLGWYLPYKPADNEYGAWKKHYVACTVTLDMNVSSRNASAVYGRREDGSFRKKKIRQKGISENESMVVMMTRPDWLPPDKTPRDLEKSSKAVFEEYNPNEPEVHRSLTLAHNRFGISKSKLSFYRNTEEPRGEYGVQSSSRQYQHRALVSGDLDLRHSFPMALSETVKLESYEERRLMELVAKPWEPPPPDKLPFPKRPNLSGGGEYPLPWKHIAKQRTSKSFPAQEHPRIIFISSRIPAADLLVDAVIFGVIPIVYEYEGTSLESLLSRIDRYLQGRSAQSIGFFTHSEAPYDDLRLVHGATVNVDNLDNPDFISFFETVGNAVLPAQSNGHIDIFSPVASCEAGVEMLKQLNILTGVQFTSPTGLIGQYNHIQSEWLCSPEANLPSELYFASTKLNVWVNTADQAQEACRTTKHIMAKYFEQVHKDVVAQLTGQVVFDALAQTDIQGVNEVANTLVEGFISLGHQKNSKPIEYLGKFLLEKAGIHEQKFSLTRPKQAPEDTLAPTLTMGANTLSAQLTLSERFEDSLQESEEIDTELANNTHKRNKENDNRNKVEIEKDDSEIPEEIGQEEISEVIDVEGNIEEKQDGEFQEKHVSLKTTSGMKMSFNTTNDNVEEMSSIFASSSSIPKCDRIPRRLTTEEFRTSPEKRTLIGREILASEMEYMRTLDIIKKQFYAPLKAALDSNRAVISSQNIQVIFTDSKALLELSKSLVAVLKTRIDAWNPDQCLGDIFIKFATKLKAFTNFLNNYPIILTTVERCMEQIPGFRAFLKRHERQPITKMMTLPELLLSPGRRVTEYITLLTWFKTYTPEDHADRHDLSSAIKSLAALDQLFRDVKDKADRERELTLLQTRIIKCPMLLEANRFFLRQLDVAHLEAPTDCIIPELRVYKHIEMLGLYLFNDSLVVARRTTKNFPFERRVEYVYRFETCTALDRLRTEDIPDSKYVQNAFMMFTPRRKWICSTDTYEEKLNWTTLLEHTIRTTLGVN